MERIIDSKKKMMIKKYQALSKLMINMQKNIL